MYHHFPVAGRFARLLGLEYLRARRRMLDDLPPGAITSDDPLRGAYRMLAESHQQFDVIDDQCDLVGYIDDVIPLHDVEVAVRLCARPKRAYLAPQRADLAFEWMDGMAKVTAPQVAGHQMVAYEVA